MGFQESLPRHPFASLWSRLDTVFFQDSFDGVPPYPMAQITQSVSDPSITPGRIVFRHPDDESLSNVVDRHVSFGSILARPNENICLIIRLGIVLILTRR